MPSMRCKKRSIDCEIVAARKGEEDFDSSSPRSGKWTLEEETFAFRLIRDFEAGALHDCEDGCTLRSYLARKLNCAPMRISKKFAGKCIGKHTFSSNAGALTRGALHDFWTEPADDVPHSSKRRRLGDLHLLGGARSASPNDSDYSDDSLRSPESSLDDMLLPCCAFGYRLRPTSSFVSLSFTAEGVEESSSEGEDSIEAEEWRDVLDYFCGSLDDDADAAEEVPHEVDEGVQTEPIVGYESCAYAYYEEGGSAPLSSASTSLLFQLLSAVLGKEPIDERVYRAQRRPEAFAANSSGPEDDQVDEREEFGKDLVFSPSMVQPRPLEFSCAAAQASDPVAAAADDDALPWLLNRCSQHLQLHTTATETHTSEQLALAIVDICQRSDGADAAQMPLFDLLGEQALDFLAEVLSRFPQIRQLDQDGLRMEQSYESYPAGRGTKELSANQRRRQLQREQKQLDRIRDEQLGEGSGDWLQALGFSEEQLAEERALGLQRDRSDLSSWTAGLAPLGTSSGVQERRSAMPAGAVKTLGQGFEEVHIPAARRPAPPKECDVVKIADLPAWAAHAFPGTTALNPIQSAVFPSAFGSSENLLVCAPTGAGKTNIAMLCLLRLWAQGRGQGHGLQTNAKAVYIAPMKALAQEVVAKFSERLRPLGGVVREYTGDTQLSKQELADAHLLVCTPEKYDSATRKGGDGSLCTLVRLLIIDEVHLLADDRGAVIETIVARTQRYVESSQQLVRIVGLSATLPNYQDVASFLRVRPGSGLFYFGLGYRPVPLEQTLIGLTDKSRPKRLEMMNRKAYEQAFAALERGKQVMVFVHARRDTSKTVEALLDLACKYNTVHLLENHQHEQFTLFKRAVDKSRSSELQAMFYKGVGCHHAGMLRADRSLTEQLFECGLIKLLCCTATLAWGVNLPAHTVIIKGTELYDPERGGFVDLSVLDVLQIFGRAGRPQYDTTGHAVLITQQKALNSYLGLLAQQTPIESALIKSLADHLNAEIVNGTVNNVKEAVVWLSYSFLFVRMKRNPLAYGINFEDLFADPQLQQKRLQLITDAAEALDACMMCRFDKRSGNLAVTDLGRIASHYYIKHDSIECFNRMLSPHLLRPEAVHLLCSSSEFDQLKSRPDELPEIDQLKTKVFIKVKGSADDTASKVNILLQSYLSQARISSFTLQSDSNYVAQNASRIARALFEICLKRGWSSLAQLYLTLCKCIDRRMRLDQSPLRQLSADAGIPSDVFQRLETADASQQQLMDMSDKEIGALVHNHKVGGKIKQLARQLPSLHIETTVQPISRGIVRIKLDVRADFDWVDRFHGFAEPFWIWIEDSESEYIYHAEHFIVTKRSRHESKVLEVTIPVRDPLPAQYFVRVMSDMWVGADSVQPIPFDSISMPSQQEHAGHTVLMDLHPLPKTALRNPKIEALYAFSHFNAVQTQAFHALYHSDRNVLVGAPTGSGKTLFAELAIYRLLAAHPGSKVVYVAPLKALARERLKDWQVKLVQGLGLTVLELTGEVTPDTSALMRADILIVTPEKWDSISRGWRRRSYVAKVGLLVIDEILLLGVDRGPVLEVLVSRMRFIAAQTGQPIRFLGLSTALANAADLGDWLGVPQAGLFNFRPSVRPVPMTIHIQGFPGKHYCPRMATMNKPAYAAILEHSPSKPVLIFVSSRRQTRLTALDLISYCAADDDPKRFLGMDEQELAAVAAGTADKSLRDCLSFGIGIHHAGLSHADRAAVEELFAKCKIQVLVCTSTLAWGVNLPCHLVIVKGSEYFDGKAGGYADFPVTDILQMIGRAGRPQFDSSAVACIFVQEAKKMFYRKFLHEPFPVESSLHLQLHEHINAELANGSIASEQDAVEYLSWTYLYRRLLVNPSYYLVPDAGPTAVRGYLLQLIRGVVQDLVRAECITSSEEDGGLQVSCLGMVAASYYLNHRTPQLFRSRFRALSSLSSSNGEQATRLSWQLLKVLCDAPEFAEHPVRHNEDLLNEQLAVDLRAADTGVALTDMLSPHTKVFLLLLAHLQRARMPIADYGNDLKSVADQLPRVLNAMADVAAEEGLAVIVRCLLTIGQCVRQAVSFGAAAFELLQIPLIGDAAQAKELASALRTAGAPPTLQGLRRTGRAKAGHLLRQVCTSSAAQQQQAASLDLLFGANGWPLLAEDMLKVSLRTLPSSSEEVEVEISITSASSSAVSKGSSSNSRMTAMSWWAMVTAGTSSAGGELLAMKRVSSVTASGTTVIRMSCRPPHGVQQLTVSLQCDALAGIGCSRVVSL